MDWFLGLGVGVIFISIVFYFLPAIIAFSRGHKNAVSILLLDLLLGWTFLDWVLALVWSFSANTKEVD